MNSDGFVSAFTPVGNFVFPNGTIKERESYKWNSFSPPALWHIWNNYTSNFSVNGECVSERASKGIPVSWPWSLYSPYISQDYSSALLHHTSCSQFLGLTPCPEDEKPSQSYIGLIGQAILNSPEKKLILSEIYNYIQTQYPYFRKRGTGWRNSIRHNLSLNDCFIKTGRSPNGKGHFWAISPLYYDDFARGVIRRRTSRRASRSSRIDRVSEEIKEIIPVPKVRNTPIDDKLSIQDFRGMVKKKLLDAKIEHTDSENVVKAEKRKAYDVESLLAPEPISKELSRIRCPPDSEPQNEQEIVPILKKTEFLSPPCHP